MEIERKFLVEKSPDGLTEESVTPIEQGYLAIDDESEVRLRRAGDSLKLTVKSGHGESRDETEVDVDQATFDDLWPESEGRRIEKSRSKIRLGGGLVAELDRYGGVLDGLVVVEVEFTSPLDAAEFLPPPWFGRELTGDRAWANQSLATAGLPEKRLEFRLRPGEEPGTGVCRVIAARTAQAAAEVRQAGESDDPGKHVHEARKSLKKARSALRLLRGVISDEERSAANHACREAARRLSGARDAEVKIETLDLVGGKDGSGGAGEGWRQELEKEAAGHRGELTPAALAGVAVAIEKVRRDFQGRQFSGVSEAVAGNAGRGYRRGRKAMKQARKHGDAEPFHTWRKRAKDLRYQLEILEPRLPEPFTEVRQRAEKLADLLGDLHDLDVLLEDLESRGYESRDTKRLKKLIGAAREKQVDDCLELGQETYDVKPGKFTNRVAESLSDPA